MIIKLKYKKLGGHIHCRVFTAKAKGFTFATNGELVFSEDEWSLVYDALNSIMNLEEEEDEKHKTNS